MKTVKIRDRDVGDGHPPYILAEIGINHMGNFDMAKRLVELAAQNGADGVKFQGLTQDNVTTYELQPELWFAIAKAQLSADDDAKLEISAHKLGVDFIESVFCIESLKYLRSILTLDAIKIASGDITNYPLLQAAGSCGLPVILSTGASDGREVGQAVELLNRSGCDQIVILHCVSLYPTMAAQVNLKAMDKLKVFGYPVGFSDHTIGNEIAFAAIARGASFIEKHFTFSHDMPGDDHLCSMDVDELVEMVLCANCIKSALNGSEIKEPHKGEQPKAIRRGLYAARDMEAGEVLTEADIRLLRPQGELSAMIYPKLIGATLTSDLTALEEITDAKI